ncbi:hypothetical protein GA0070606_5648 [Micromonospora citrea]|uniref:Uncharacterized protein n=1 Tax=Micromonospora citrea TaxID=47855 RepID=A0A1C6VYK3_9ACTN|nr:hypothetical protein [Micromonospora citrea]SCL71204.1 hypothetical protein GA0070606_5648 [Micromonospora citrea]
MFGAIRRPRAPLTTVRFCDSCAQVSTSAERAERRYDATRTTTHALISPR